MSTFSIDIKGQLNNMRLSASKSLWPLFEAVINAIHSIEDSQNCNNGRITIAVIRDDDPKLSVEQQILSKVNSFIIEDNGLGFNEENYKSFNTAYSTLKVKKGCKGIGRFLWLKAFDSVEINSTYCEYGQYYNRSFKFTSDGIEPDNNKKEASSTNVVTSVRLNNFIKEYKDNCPVELDSIAKKVIEHCLLYFTSDKCPQIIIQDEESTINLNDYFNKTIKDSLHQDSFSINQEQFTIYHMRVPEGVNTHQLNLCANMQEVSSIELKKYIPNLQKKIKTLDEAIGDFFYVGYVTSNYLDSIVNTTRTSFEFDEINNQLSLIGTGKDFLITTAVGFVKTYLNEYINDIDKQKRHEIDTYAENHPQYRYLLNIKPEVYDNIPAGLAADSLELELHKEVQKWETDIKKKGIQLEQKDSSIDTETYNQLYEEYWENVTDLSKTCLAEYVTRRKTLLKMLEDALTIQDTGKFKKESVIHSIICPMQHTSNDVSYEEMNLWIVDERMAYHRYLASDKTLKSMPVIDSNSTKEPDIVIFDQAFAFSDNEEPFSSITIIEFKKPDNDNKNPWDQVGQYIDLIRNGSKKKANGQSFNVNEGTVFRCYVICDLTDKMRTHCSNAGLLSTADNTGYAGYNPTRHAYYEAISYQKLIADAKKRNEILFDKLFSPDMKKIKHFPGTNHN